MLKNTRKNKNRRINTWRSQQQHGPEAVPVKTGITHGPNVRGGREVLGQASEVERPLPWVPLVYNVLRVENILQNSVTFQELSN